MKFSVVGESAMWQLSDDGGVCQKCVSVKEVFPVASQNVVREDA